MKYSYDGFNYWLRFDKGENLHKNMQAFMEETGIDGGWVSGIGAALEGELGFYNLETKEYQWTKFDGMREILSLQGTLAKNEVGEMMFHLHGTFGDQKYQTIGGHVKDLTVGGTLELFVHRAFVPLKRKTDENVGLQTLDL